MRIITGDYKGRRLYVPKDKYIRPTTDKVKEAIFSILASQVYDSTVLDLFAGTGNLGLEALSRGAAHCYFGDHSRTSLRLINENIEYCRAREKSTVIPGDFKKVISMVKEPCDIIFLDPPYQQNMTLDCFQYIEDADILSDDGIIIAEHGKKELLPDQIGSFQKVKERKYGTIVISMYSCDVTSNYDTI